MNSRRTVGTVLAGSTLVAAAVFLASPHLPGPAQAQASEPAPSIDAERVAATLVRLGYDAEALAAAGASAVATEGIVDAAYVWLLANNTSLHTADTALADARADHASLRTLAQRGQATDAQKIQLADAADDLDGAEAALDALFSLARTSIGGDLTADQRATIATIESNRAVYGMPTHCAADSWSEEDWLELRAAAVCVRQAGDKQESAPQEAQDVVDDAMARAAVSDAANNLDLNRAAVTEAWEDAVAVY